MNTSTSFLAVQNINQDLPSYHKIERSETSITPREQEILHLIAYEHSSKEIASKLFISCETVNSHRKNIMSKLEVKNTAGMVRVAFEKRLLQLFCILLLSLGSQLSFGQTNQLPAGYAAELKVEIININGVVDDETFRGNPELRVTATAQASNNDFTLNSQCNPTLDGIAIPYNPNPEIMVGSHNYQGGEIFSDSIALSFEAHEDDSNPSNCTINSSDDFVCFKTPEKVSILSLTSSNTGGTLFKTITGCSNAWVITFKITVTFIPPTLACLSAQSLVSGQEVAVDLRSAQVDSDNDGAQCDLDSAGLWYTFIGTGRGVRIELCEQNFVSNIDPELAILSGSCGNLTCISSTETVVSKCSMIDIMTSENETFYVHIIKKSETYVDFNLTYIALPPSPDNDNCDEAISLNVHDDLGCQSSQPASLYGATKSSAGLGSAFYDERDVWFSFVAEDTSQYIYIDNTYVIFQLFDNHCNGLNLLATYEEKTSSIAGLTIGATYYIRAYEDVEHIDEYDEDRLDFNICMGRDHPADECAGAIQLTVGSECSPQLFTFAGSTNGQNECYKPSIWFKLTVPTSGAVAIQTSGPGTSSNTEISVYAGTCSNLIEVINCHDENNSGDNDHELIYISQAAGTELFLLIASYEEMSSFSVCAYEPYNSEIASTSDDCGGATILEVGSSCEPTLYTFVGATGNTNECSSDAGVWFKAIIPVSGNLAFSTLYPGTVEDTEIIVYSGSCGSLIDISDGCQDNDNTIYDNHEQITLNGLTAGDTLYIVVSDRNGDEGIFSVCAYDPGSDTVPSDVCVGATLLSVGSTCVPTLYTFEGANNDVDECSNDAGVWFKVIIPVSGNLAFSTLYPGTIEDTEIIVYSGTCGSLIDISDGCQDDDNTRYGNHEQIFLTGQTPGDTLHILVSDNDGDGDGGTFSVCAHDGTDPDIERPTSDECPEAILLVVGSICEPILYTFDGASGYEDYECGSDDGVWFQLVVPPSGNLLFTTLSPGTVEDIVIRVYGDTCGSFTDISNGCQDFNNTIYEDHEQILITGQTPGETIYIVVVDDDDDGGTFSVCAYEISNQDLGISAADDCAGAMELAVGNTCVPSLYNFIGATNSADECSGDGVWFKVEVPTSGNLVFKTLFPGTTFDTRIKIYEGTCGDFTLLSQDCQNENNTEDVYHERIILTGRSPGTMLYIVVQDVDNGGGTFSVCAVDPSAAELGISPSDDCAGATLLTVGSTCEPSLYNFNGATHGPYECGDNGVWFKVVVPSSGDLFFSTFLSETIGTSVETKIKVYRGTCGDFLLLSEDCQDNDNTGSEDHEQLNLSGLTPGETLYLLVDDSGEGGTFKVCASSNLDNDNCTTSDIDVNLAQIAFSQDSTYKTINTITSGVKLSAYEAFLFRAPQSIDLRNYFEVPVGIELKVEIGPCN